MWQEAQLLLKIFAPVGSSAARAGLINVSLNIAIAKNNSNKIILKAFSSQSVSSNLCQKYQNHLRPYG
ncbi:asr0257 [Nostoc sp. PCC 7120 = FACHB-418]|nr:asr0257 [Nostoc sp. PCC 7120 = FACHB-418]